jgi:hypothetical protein
MRAFSVRCAGQPQVASTRAKTAPCRLRAVSRPCARPRLVAVHVSAGPHAEEEGLYVDLSPGFAFYKARACPQPVTGGAGWAWQLAPGRCGHARRTDATARAQVEAVIRPWRLQHVVKALSDGGIRGLTTYEVRGLGAQGGSRERYAGHEFDEASLVDKVKCEVVVVAGQVGPGDVFGSFEYTRHRCCASSLDWHCHAGQRCGVHDHRCCADGGVRCVHSAPPDSDRRLQ